MAKWHATLQGSGGALYRAEITYEARNWDDAEEQARFYADRISPEMVEVDSVYEAAAT